jgi:hypothetical protein
MLFGSRRKKFAHAYEALNRLAARALAKDAAGTLAELGKTSMETEGKSEDDGGNA